jgi:hypothetical protein
MPPRPASQARNLQPSTRPLILMIYGWFLPLSARTYFGKHTGDTISTLFQCLKWQAHLQRVINPHSPDDA